jgi:hypothetical protein
MPQTAPTPPASRRDLFRAATGVAALAAAAAVLSRRLKAAAAAEPAPAAGPAAASPAAGRRPRVLLHSGWQFVHVGEMAQTPGALRLFERHLPDAEVTLWLAHTTDANTAMLRRRFPNVRIVEGSINPATLAVAGDELKQALAAADLVVHGSSSSALAVPLLAWCQANAKPYGLLGVTLGNIDDRGRALLANARFVYCRDSPSLEALRKAGLSRPDADDGGGNGGNGGGRAGPRQALGFCPDTAFAIDVRDDAAATAFLAAAKLEAGRFVCGVPRLRHPPFRRLPPDQLKQRADENERFAEPDHRKLRDALSAVVRQGGRRVLVCPEMRYQLDVMDKLVIDPLPPDVRPGVVKRAAFWLPDEAAAVYAKAAVVVSFELHPCVLALAGGTPAVHLRQPTDTRKGQMLRDVGLAEWVLEVDDVTGEQIGRTVLAILADPAAAKAKVAKAMAAVDARFAEAFATVGKLLA